MKFVTTCHAVAPWRKRKPSHLSRCSPCGSRSFIGSRSASVSGFTLVELSIVIVIIGLIIAGVTAGQSIVRQAGLRAVLTELDAYKASISSFKLQYNALPGDLSNAYSYWGASCAGSAAACNGSGNGRINELDIAGRQEAFMAWKHMSLAGLIQGTYTGNSVLTNYETTPGLNTPTSKMPKGEWFVADTLPWYAANVDALLTSKRRLIIGAHRTISENEAPLFTPAEARSIDSKIDDGVPYLGRVVGLIGSVIATNCITGAGVSATYSLSQSGLQCWIWAEF